MLNAPELMSTVDASLPQLAWVCRVDLNTLKVEVRHGTSVESGCDFIVEGVWDGLFSEANFHMSDNFFGSGVRLTTSDVWIVPSRALVDRIVYCTVDGFLYASNSLTLLLGLTGAELVEDHDYREQTTTLLHGIFSYNDRFPISHPRITEFHQLLHRPLIIGATLRMGEPSAKVRLESFHDYELKLTAVIERLKANADSDHRNLDTIYFSTISSGYDSTAVTTIARNIGFERCFTAKRSWKNILPLINSRFFVDDGTPIARKLGVPTAYFRKPNGNIDETEILWYAPCSDGAQVLFHSMVTQIAQKDKVALLFTGFHGDKVWDVATSSPYDSDEIRRGDVSGLDLSEIRLFYGFINVAVPFIFARSIADLVTISRSEEMRNWRMLNDYDRPIPRRIVESVGVPRGAFGREKRAALQRPPFPHNRRLRKRFLQHIYEKYGISPAYSVGNRLWFRFRFIVVTFLKRLNFLSTLRISSRAPQSIDMSYELHIWALSKASEGFRYKQWFSSIEPGTDHANSSPVV
jgi:hypothetical protein